MSPCRQLLLVATGCASTLLATAAWTQGRKTLREQGFELQASYLSETAANITGGDHHELREAGELALGARFDMERLLDVRGGSVQATVTWRRGDNLVRDAGLDTLELVQANYGRGQSVRLTQFWYQQAFSHGRIDVKLGRLTAGEDFAALSCDFMNLSFCGARPGSVVSEYWYNWPVSQWAMRWRYRTPRGYAQVGALEVNPKNLEKGLTIGRFSGATGVLIPLEVAWTPTLTASRLPGTYKIGVWYDTSTADDALLDVSGAPHAVSGAPALQRRGRYGVYGQIRQQLTGRADGAAADGAAAAGLSAFLNIVQAETRTSRIDRQIGLGLTYGDPLYRGAADEVGVAIGTTHLNKRFSEYQRVTLQQISAASSEYLAEIYLRYAVTSWLTLQPNVQYIVSPGGRADRDDVTIAGLRVTASAY